MGTDNSTGSSSNPKRHGDPDRPSADGRVIAGEVVRARVEDPHATGRAPASATPFAAFNDDTVHRVTSAKRGLTEQQRARIRRYIISMTIRTVCFIGAVVSWINAWPWPVTLLLVLGATVLPYVAVVMANAGHESDAFTVEPVPAEGDLPAVVRQRSPIDDAN